MPAPGRSHYTKLNSAATSGHHPLGAPQAPPRSQPRRGVALASSVRTGQGDGLSAPASSSSCSLAAEWLGPSQAPLHSDPIQPMDKLSVPPQRFLSHASQTIHFGRILCSHWVFCCCVCVAFGPSLKKDHVPVFAYPPPIPPLQEVAVSLTNGSQK